MRIVKERFEKALFAENITQQELADLMFVGKDSISNWKLGKHTPTKQNLIDMCNILHVLPEYLTGDIDYRDLDDWKKNYIRMDYKTLSHVYNMFLDMGYVLNWQQLENDWNIRENNFAEYKESVIDVITPSGEHKKTSYEHILQAYSNFINTFKSSLINLDSFVAPETDFHIYKNS